MTIEDREVRVLHGPVGVFLLDRDGRSTLAARGWQGEEIFVGRWEATPNEIAAAVSLEMQLEIEVHAVVTTAERTWIVVRPSSRYGQTSREE